MVLCMKIVVNLYQGMVWCVKIVANLYPGYGLVCKNCSQSWYGLVYENFSQPRVWFGVWKLWPIYTQGMVWFVKIVANLYPRYGLVFENCSQSVYTGYGFVRMKTGSQFVPRVWFYACENCGQSMYPGYGLAGAIRLPILYPLESEICVVKNVASLCTQVMVMAYDKMVANLYLQGLASHSLKIVGSTVRPTHRSDGLADSYTRWWEAPLHWP